MAIKTRWKLQCDHFLSSLRGCVCYLYLCVIWSYFCSNRVVKWYCFLMVSKCFKSVTPFLYKVVSSFWKRSSVPHLKTILTPQIFYNSTNRACVRLTLFRHNTNPPTPRFYIGFFLSWDLIGCMYRIVQKFNGWFIAWGCRLTMQWEPGFQYGSHCYENSLMLSCLP